MPHHITLPGGDTLSDDPARLNLEAVHEWLLTTYWARHRPVEQTRRSWNHCMAVSVLTAEGALAGFGRLLTDSAFRAHLGDVFILPDHRGRGLGKALVEYLLAHPDLADVNFWTLTTGDAHGLYTRHGFRFAENDGQWMALDRSAHVHRAQE